MNFLEKNLEAIIWENYPACVERGLRIGFAYAHGVRYRQMNLLPYGIADLVNIWFEAAASTLHIQVIECKRDKINAETYAQARRYAAAVEAVCMSIENEAFRQIKTETTVVLVGASVDTNSPFIHAIAQDRSCSTFTYSYGVNGIEFQDMSNWWWLNSTPGMCMRGDFMSDNHGIERYVRKAAAEYINFVEQQGDYSQALLITPTGISVNPIFQ